MLFPFVHRRPLSFLGGSAIANPASTIVASPRSPSPTPPSSRHHRLATVFYSLLPSFSIDPWSSLEDYHFVYKDVEGSSTQWDDIQRKLGNLPPKPPAFKPPAFFPAEDEDSKPKEKSWIDSKTEEGLKT